MKRCTSKCTLGWQCGRSTGHPGNHRHHYAVSPPGTRHEWRTKKTNRCPTCHQSISKEQKDEIENQIRILSSGY